MDIAALRATITLGTSGFTQGVGSVIAGMGKIGGVAIALNQSLELIKTGFAAMKSVMSSTVGGIVDTSAKFETLDVLLKQVEGSSERAAAAQGFIVEKSKGAFSIDAITDSYVKFRSVGIDPTKGALDALLNGMAAFGKVTDAEVKGAAVAIQQMMGKGVISMEELRQQLAERIPTAGRIMAKELGMSYQEMVKKIEKGGLDARTALDALFKGLNEKYKGSADAMANTWQGQMNRLRTEWDLFRKQVGEEGGLFAGIKAGLKEVISWVEKLKASGDLKAMANRMATAIIEAAERMISAIFAVIRAVNYLKGLAATAQSNINDLRIGTNQAQMDSATRILKEYDAQVKGGKPLNEDQLKYQKELKTQVKEQVKLQEELLTNQGSFNKSLEETSQLDKDLQNTLSTLKKSTETAQTAATAEQFRRDFAARQAALSGKNPLDTGIQADDLGELGLNKTGSAAKGAAGAANQLENALDSLQKKINEANYEAATAGLSQYEQAMAKINLEHQNLLIEYKKLIEANPAVRGMIDGLAESLRKAEVAKAGRELKDAIDQMDFQILALGMNESARAAAEVNFRYRDMIAVFTELKPKVDELAGKEVKLMEVSKLKEINDELKNIQFEITIAGMSDTAAAFAKVNFEIDKMIEKMPSLAAQYEQLRAARLDLIGKQMEAAITKLYSMETVAREVTSAMAGPLADFFQKFAETGKANFQELINALVKSLQAYAAQKTAHLLMEAAYHGVMAFIEPGMGHGEKALAALKGAAIMGSFVLGSGLAGMAHDGITQVPEDGTWLLQKNERVVDADTNKDLTQFLKDGGKPAVNMTVNINNSDEEGVMKAIPHLKETILEVVNGDISTGGSTLKNIQAYL